MIRLVKVKPDELDAAIAHYADPRETLDGLEDHAGRDADMLRARVERGISGTTASLGRKLRHDANVIMEWRIELPEDMCLIGELQALAHFATRFAQERYGAENVPGGFLHARGPGAAHVHIPVVPIEGGRLRSSRVVPQSDASSFPRDLSLYVSSKMRVVLLFSDDKPARTLSGDELAAALEGPSPAEDGHDGNGKPASRVVEASLEVRFDDDSSLSARFAPDMVEALIERWGVSSASTSSEQRPSKDAGTHAIRA